MSNQVLCTNLVCSVCGAETTHIVCYIGYYIKSVTCSTCRHVVTHNSADLRSQFIHDMPARAIILIRRNVRSVREHPVTYVRHLPHNLMLKPLAIATELYGLLSMSS